MRTPIHFFVSYAHEDRQAATSCLKLLTQQLMPSKRYAYTLWSDTQLLVGERWHDEIQQALETCQLGLLLISPNFLSSDYITQHELPRFMGDTVKPIIPLMLQPVNSERHDLKGLEHHQLFRLDQSSAFGDCNTRTARRRFAEQLFDQIERRLDRVFTPA